MWAGPPHQGQRGPPAILTSRPPPTRPSYGCSSAQGLRTRLVGDGRGEGIHPLVPSPLQQPGYPYTENTWPGCLPISSPGVRGKAQGAGRAPGRRRPRKPQPGAERECRQGGRKWMIHDRIGPNLIRVFLSPEQACALTLSAPHRGLRGRGQPSLRPKGLPEGSLAGLPRISLLLLPTLFPQILKLLWACPSCPLHLA